MERIYLVGFMGVGKTTVGKLLSRRLRWSFVDLDEQIVHRAGQTIPDIFTQHGEGYFRQSETQALKACAVEKKTVFSTGGGIVGRDENRQLMAHTGTVIYLHADWPLLRQRLVDVSQRPMAKDTDDNALQELFSQRLPLYQQADFVIDTGGKTASAVVQEICQRLEEEKLI
ncbi:MAG: shikimate kinase [Desulfuromonadaceae bacterium]|nr:shikimate kinase [Desulfuromonadaceae bacterium]